MALTSVLTNCSGGLTIFVGKVVRENEQW